MIKLEGKNKIICLGIVLLILAGIIVVALKGFNVDLMYSNHEEIDIVIGKDFELSDVKNITNEVFNKRKVNLRKIEVFEDAVAIDIEYTTENELNSLKDKMNEVYGLSLETIESKTVANLRIRDIVDPYIFPVSISFVILLVFVVIRYRKIASKAFIKLPIDLLIKQVVLQASLMSIIAIFRIPFSKMILPILIIIGLISCIIWISKNEKKLVALKEKK